jgi:recombination protein RecT
MTTKPRSAGNAAPETKTNGNGNGASTGQEIRPITDWEKRRNHLRGLLTQKGFQSLLQSAIPSHVQLDPRSLAWQAITIIETPNQEGVQPIFACTDASICRAVLKAATAGLQFQGEAFLIPYADECTFMASVWGELHVVQRSGKVKRVWADVIYEADDYRIVRGLNPMLEHDITESFALDGANYPIGDGPLVHVADKGRGAALCSYACAELDTGVLQWTIMTEAECAQARKASKSAKSTAHMLWPDEMRKKMSLRRLMKTLPKSPDYRDVAEIEKAEFLEPEIERGLKTVIETTGEVTSRVLEPPRPSMGDDLTEQLRRSTEAQEAVKVAPAAQQTELPKSRDPGQGG